MGTRRNELSGPAERPWGRAHAASARLRRALVMPGSAHGKAARISAPILGVGLIGKARAHLAVEPMFAMLLVKTHYTARPTVRTWLFARIQRHSFLCFSSAGRCGHPPRHKAGRLVSAKRRPPVNE